MKRDSANKSVKWERQETCVKEEKNKEKYTHIYTDSISLSLLKPLSLSHEIFVKWIT